MPTPRQFGHKLPGTFAVLVIVAITTAIAAGGVFAQRERVDLRQILSIINDRKCPCQCGNYLPGSKKQPACFGCSVGKADVSRVIEGLIAGRDPVAIMFELDETILVNVFADYTDAGLAPIWERTVEVANASDVHRVVLRSTGQTKDARRAIRLAECAREQSQFLHVHELLIDHAGPWDRDTLIDLAESAGLDRAAVEDRLSKIKIQQMLGKNRQHSEQRRLGTGPTVTINREVVPSDREGLRKAIRAALMDGRI
jgi:2-hydroxychromene-2-carboxylate isomerase